MASSLMVLGLAACSAAVIGCGATPYRLDLSDQSSDVAVRIHIDGRVDTWLDRDGQGLTLIVADASPSGTIELIDPASCEVLDRQPLPPAGSTIFYGGPALDLPHVTMDFAPGASTSRPPTPPNFTGCQ